MTLFLAIILFAFSFVVDAIIKSGNERASDAKFQQYKANIRKGQNFLLLRLYILEEMEKIWDTTPAHDAKIEAVDLARQRVIAEGFLPDNVHRLGPIHPGYRSRPVTNEPLFIADACPHIYHEWASEHDYKTMFNDMKAGAFTYLDYSYAADFGVVGDAGYIPYSYKSTLLPEEVKENPYYKKDRGRQFGMSPERVEQIRDYQIRNGRRPCGNPIFCYDE